LSPGNPLAEAEVKSAGCMPRSGQAGRIHVCHIASGDLWAGAEVQIATLLKYLARDDGIVLSAILLNPGRLADTLSCLNVECVVFPEGQMGFLEILRHATRFLQGKGVRVLHSHRYKENLLATLLARRLDNPIVIRTRHGLVEPQKGLKDLKQRVIQSVDRLTARWATDCIIGVSAELARHLSRHFGREKVAIIPNGVDIEQVRSTLSVAEARVRLGFPADCQLVGAAGRLEPVKRLDIFLEAGQKISRQNPSARFIIAGTGREAIRLQALAGELGLEDRVQFLGHRDDIFDVLRALDILVLSSDHEGLPMVLLEALAMGLTVVARRVGGISEVVTDDVSGILVPSDSAADLASACLHALADEALRRRLGEAGRSSVLRNFSAEQTASEVAGLYRSLVGR
jgi:glycosyltransferase involved in cell wall biosynthesis